MFRNYLAAALRNLVRNRLYAAINVVGLAIGLAVALLIAVFVRAETSFDDWLPGHERVYQVFVTLTLGSDGGRREEENGMPVDAASWMRIELSPGTLARVRRVRESIRHGDIEGVEQVAWADPDFFKIAAFPVVAGDLGAALSDPDSIVITRRMARKYFGRDTPLGEVLEVRRDHALQIVAVIEDLPNNSNFDMDIIASAAGSFSPIAQDDARPPGLESQGLEWIPTYVRLPPGVDAREMEARMRTAVPRHYPKDIAGLSFAITPRLVPLAVAHFEPVLGGTSLATLNAISAVGVLTMVVAVINFLNLMTARSARRSVEVGVRKVSGAMRTNLIAQFMGESLIYILLSACGAAVLATLLLPHLNVFLQRTIALDSFSFPSALCVLGAGLLMAVTAGFYPALLLASFPPIAAFRSGKEKHATRGSLRWALVIFQFAILIVLSLATMVIYRQTVFALNEGLRLQTDQLLLIETSACTDAFKDAVASAPGVRGAACSGTGIVGARNGTVAVLPDGRKLVFNRQPSDYGLLELYDLKPLAGRFFSRAYGADAADTSTTQPALVINETFAHALGYAAPEDAVGQSISWVNQGPKHPSLAPRVSTIIGVAPDFVTRSVTDRIDPTAFFLGGDIQYLNVKLESGKIPEALRAIDRAWRESGEARPMRRYFFSEYVERLYQDISREGTLLAAFAVTAFFIATMGLFGLSAFITQQRTREIGIRKAMGASGGNILRLLLWQFAKPVLWASVLAWPAAYVIMDRWLQGFAYHVALAPWTFLAASSVALVIAIATVAGHVALVARTQPANALRHE